MNADDLKAFFPHLGSDAVGLRAAMDEGDIKGVLRECAFLAQVAHESCEFKFWLELGSGKEYENRHDMGNYAPGDGMRYKGRGPIQLTGKNNYIAAGTALGLDLVNHPELVEKHDVGCRVAVWFWTVHKLNSYASLCTPSGATGKFTDTSGNFEKISRAINTSGPNTTCKYNGKEERERYYDKLLQLHLNGPKLP